MAFHFIDANKTIAGSNGVAVATMTPQGMPGIYRCKLNQGVDLFEGGNYVMGWQVIGTMLGDYAVLEVKYDECMFVSTQELDLSKIEYDLRGHNKNIHISYGDIYVNQMRIDDHGYVRYDYDWANQNLERIFTDEIVNSSLRHEPSVCNQITAYCIMRNLENFKPRRIIEMRSLVEVGCCTTGWVAYILNRSFYNLATNGQQFDIIDDADRMTAVYYDGIFYCNKFAGEEHHDLADMVRYASKKYVDQLQIHVVHTSTVFKDNDDNTSYVYAYDDNCIAVMTVESPFMDINFTNDGLSLANRTAVVDYLKRTYG